MYLDRKANDPLGQCTMGEQRSSPWSSVIGYSLHCYDQEKISRMLTIGAKRTFAHLLLRASLSPWLDLLSFLPGAIACRGRFVA